MASFDKRFIEILQKERKIDDRIVGTLSQKDKTVALVRVRNPLHLMALERRFQVVGEYPFIRSLGIECGLEEAILLGRMAEVEYVSAESRVSCLDVDFGADNALSAKAQLYVSWTQAFRLTAICQSPRSESSVLLI